MKRKVYMILFLFLYLLPGCRDDMDHYKIPGTLSDRLVGAMEKQGDLTQFVKAVDLLEMREDLEKSSYTAFPPTDDAVLKYIQEAYSASDVSELEKEELKKLVMGHIVRNSMSWNQIRRLNIFPNDGGYWGDEVGEGGYRQEIGINWGFKLPTLYQPGTYEVMDEKAGKKRKISNMLTYLPVLDYERFSGLLEEDDYTFFFPDTKFVGRNVLDATAIRADQKSLNGMIHVIDKVIPPLKHAEEYLSKSDRYSLFYRLINRFAEYEFNSRATVIEPGSSVVDSVFVKTYQGSKIQDPLEWLAKDKPLDYTYDEDRATFCILLLPDDVTLETYLNENFVHENGYASIDDIPDEVIKVLVYGFGYNPTGTSSWTRPSQLDNFVNGNGQVVSLDKDNDINFTKMLNNGVIYGTKEVIVPNTYTAVTRPLIFDKRYSYMLRIAQKFSYKITSLVASPDMTATLFVPSNDAFVRSGYRYDEEERKYYYTDPESGDEYELDDREGGPLEQLYRTHIMLGEDHTDLSGEMYLKTMATGDYLRVKANTIQSGGNFQSSEVTTVLKVDKSGSNGTFYEIDAVLDRPTFAPSKYVLNPNKDEYSEFVKLLDRAGYIRGGVITKINGAKNITVLVPSNEAIRANLDKIPESVNDLRKFLDYYFIRDAVVFTDGKVSGPLDTYSQIARNEYNTLTAQNAPGNLTFTDAKDNTARVVVDPRYSNILASGATVHLIDNLLFAK
ncbi:hypothetical protein FUAX_20760 [Fulvitalea axinellae]|uniref:FAS1 domain-containing protein n=1 Tax=Fulvitalea axinellae TaxID=1182444 RepID=A0AAU9CC06_9BACT|nr:hypothetical protein FUAX_20760 [Fulvitalea axinellae]